MGITRYVPLYEGKMISLFDHRFGSYPDGMVSDTRALPRPTLQERADPFWEAFPRYWVPDMEVDERLTAKSWSRGWLMGWRGLTNTNNERTVIATVFPRVGVGNSLPLMLFGSDRIAKSLAGLTANLCALSLDFAARQKVGGTNLNFFIYQQLPILPSAFYTEPRLAFPGPKSFGTHLHFQRTGFLCSRSRP